VIVSDIAQDRADSVVADIKKAGGKRSDCLRRFRPRVRHGLKAEAVRTLGPPTLVFANAGVTSFDPLEKMTSQDIDWIVSGQSHGCDALCRAFLPHMLEKKDGTLSAPPRPPV